MSFFYYYHYILESSQKTVDAEGFEKVERNKWRNKWRREKVIRDQLASGDIMGEDEIHKLFFIIQTSGFDITVHMPPEDR